MSEADQFRQYADEAMSWANQSKTEKEKQLCSSLRAHGCGRPPQAILPRWGSTTVRQTTIQLGRPPQLARSQTVPHRGSLGIPGLQGGNE